VPLEPPDANGRTVDFDHLERRKRTRRASEIHRPAPRDALKKQSFKAVDLSICTRNKTSNLTWRATTQLIWVTFQSLPLTWPFVQSVGGRVTIQPVCSSCTFVQGIQSSKMIFFLRMNKMTSFLTLEKKNSSLTKKTDYTVLLYSCA
jgi:hypothetical protein